MASEDLRNGSSPNSLADTQHINRNMNAAPSLTEFDQKITIKRND